MPPFLVFLLGQLFEPLLNLALAGAAKTCPALEWDAALLAQ